MVDGRQMAHILVRRSGESWQSPEGSGYTDEAHLQGILKEYPELIPGVNAEAQVCIEFQSGVGPADVVAVDAINGLTLVECKLASNREVRREIIGQVLDYASRFWRMSVEDFDEQWRTRTSHSLFEDSQTADELRSRLEANLSSGEFRIILAVDEINSDLRRIVEYLNHVTVSSVGVIAVVFSRSEHEGMEILSRQIYGEELAEAKVAHSRLDRDRWSQDQFIAWVDENDPGASIAVRTLLQVLAESGFEIAGGKAQTPSLNMGIEVEGVGHKWPIAMYTQGKGASVELRFEDFKNLPEVAERYLLAAESVKNLPIDGAEVRNVAFSKRPNLMLRDMSDLQIRSLVIALANAFLPLQ